MCVCVCECNCKIPIGVKHCVPHAYLRVYTAGHTGMHEMK